MVMNSLEAARKLPEGVEDPGMPAAKTPEAIKIYPEISLEEEWNRQAQNLAKLFAKELKFNTPEEYVATLPTFEPQPANWKGRLDTPVLVETRIPLKRQCALAGLTYLLYGLTKEDSNRRLKDYTTPETPYAAWLEDGRNNLNKKPKDVRRNLKPDELRGTEFDGVALYISNPKILEHHYLDLPGTSVGSAGAAFLDLWHGRPRLYYHWIDFARPEFGSVVRWRKK